MSLRIQEHPILGEDKREHWVDITIDGNKCKAIEGEMIAAALLAQGIVLHRYTSIKHEPRGIYCGIGQCTDCVMSVNGKPNVRTCVTPIEAGMVIETQQGVGKGDERK